MKRKEQFKMERTAARQEMMRNMNSSDPTLRQATMESFAAFLGQLVEKLLDQRSTIKDIYTDYLIGPNDNPTIEVDPNLNYKAGDIRVWQQASNGNLHYNQLQGLTEYPVMFYTLQTAIAIKTDILDNARVDLLSNYINRATQEFVARQEVYGWQAIIGSAANATDNGLSHVVGAGTPGVLKVDDLNKLEVRSARLYESFAGGSIEGDEYGLTDIFASPERFADLRAMAYQPQNTVPGSLTTSGATALGLPEEVRAQLFRTGGVAEFFGVQWHMLRELGLNKRLTKVFDSAYQGTFDASTTDVLIGLDLNRNTFLRPVRTDKDGGQISTIVDDQFPVRLKQRGWYMEMTEGRSIIDNRGICFLTI